MGKILKIREVGDPVLNLVCQKVDVQNINNETLEDIEDLKETLKFTGGFGIAGPEVGINNGEKIVKRWYNIFRKSNSRKWFCHKRNDK